MNLIYPGFAIIHYLLLPQPTLTADLVSFPTTDHLSIWFNHKVRYYPDEGEDAYSRNELSSMISLISTRFKKVYLEPAPPLHHLPLPGDYEDDLPSQIWIPQLIAQQSKRSGGGGPKLKAVVSFSYNMDNSIFLRSGRRANVTPSFQVAKFMADAANKVQPGTVDTLLYSNFVGRSSFISDAGKILNTSAVLRRNESGRGYKLGVTVDLTTCGEFGGPLGSQLATLLPAVDLVVVVIHKKYGSTQTWPRRPQQSLQMFENLYSDCASKITRAQVGVQVVPLFTCNSVLESSDSSTNPRLKECWSLMSSWSSKKGDQREVLMLEAFDTPNQNLRVSAIRHHKDLRLAGWWRLKDEGEYELSEDSFVEKIGESNVTTTTPPLSPPPPPEVCQQASASPSQFSSLEYDQLPSSSNNLDTAISSLAIIFTAEVVLTTLLFAYVGLSRANNNRRVGWSARSSARNSFPTRRSSGGGGGAGTGQENCGEMPERVTFKNYK